MPDGFDLDSVMSQAAQGKLPGQPAPQQGMPRTSEVPASSLPPRVADHPAPDGSGGTTSLSDADYYKYKGQSSGALPQVNLPQITTGGNPSQAQGAGGTGILALPAPGSPQNQVIDVSGAKPEQPASTGTSGPAPFDIDGLMTQAKLGKLPPPAAPPAPQMTGIGRLPAMAGSGLAQGAVGLLGFPGDIAHGVTALGGAQAAGELQGNPFPAAPTFNEPGKFSAFPVLTPQALAAAPGKQQITPPTGHNPIDTETLTGLTNAMGLTNRPDLQPQGLGENLLSGASKGVGMVAPTMLTGGVSTVPAALRLLRTGAAMGVGGEGGGMVGQALGGTPGALIGGALGSVAPSLGAAAIMRGARAMGPMIQNALPVTQGAREAVAARSFAPANTPEIRAALAAPKELVPNSPVTSYQATGNPFLGAQERGIANRVQYKPAFDEVRQAQNAARVASIKGQAPKDADVGGIIPWFRGRLERMRAEEGMDTGEQRAVTQNAVDAMGNPIAPHEAGATVRGAVEGVRAPVVAQSDRAIEGAQRRAETATSGIGGEPAEHAVQQHGTRMRGEASTGELPGTGLEGARIPVRDAASRLYDAVDPEGKLALNVGEVGKTARDLLKDVNPRMGGQLEAHEAPVLNAAATLRGVELFSDLRSLRSHVSTALRELAQGPGTGSPAYRRMTLLMDSIEDAMSKGAGDAARGSGEVAERLAKLAEEEHGPVVGESGGPGHEAGAGGGEIGVPVPGGAEGQGTQRPGNAPGPGAVAVTQPGRQLQSLVDFVISKGGVKESRGDLRANDLQLVHHRAGGRLLNPKGMNADDMARLAHDEGFPTPDLNSFTNQLASATPVYRSHEMAEASAARQQARETTQEQHERMMAAANVDEAVSTLGVRLSPQEQAHATELALHGAHPEDAVRQAVRAGDEDVFQRNAEHNAVGAPGVPLGAAQAEMPVGREQLTANFAPEDAQALRRANAAWADYKERFGKGAVGNVLQSSSKVPGGYRVPDSMVPSALFTKGPKGAETADSLIAATGSSAAALHVLGDYPAYSLRQAAEEMGTLNVKKYDAWMTAHQAVMDKFPELKASFDTAAKARAVLDDLKNQRAAIDAANPIKPGWGDAEVMQRFVQPGPKGYEAAENLIKATGDSPTAKAATRDYLASSLREAAEIKSGPNAGTLDLGAYQRWLKQYGSFLSHPSMADVRQSFGEAGVAQAELDAAAAAHQRAQRAYESSVARHFLPDDTDPVSAIGKILGSGNPGAQMADLARQTASDPKARESIQAAVIRYMLRRLESNNPVGTSLEETYLKANESQNFIRQHVGTEGEGALRQIMTPEQLEALNNVALDMRRSNLSISGNKNPGGSDTGLITSAREADEHAASPATMFGLMEVAGDVGEKVLDTKWGRVVGAIGVPLLNLARKAGFHTINDLRAEALLHPDKLSALLARLPTTESQMSSRFTAIKGQLAALSAVSGTRAANENSQQTLQPALTSR